MDDYVSTCAAEKHDLPGKKIRRETKDKENKNDFAVFPIYIRDLQGACIEYYALLRLPLKILLKN